MVRLGQNARVLVYAFLAPVLFVGLILAGDYQWVVVLFVGLVLLSAALERCPSCGGALLLFKPKRGADGPLVCKACWDEGGQRPDGPADPAPRRR